MTINSDTATSRSAARTVEHRTVTRVMSILEHVVASEPNGLRLADLADVVGAPKSSLHGLARGLVATGYLRDEHGRYLQGAALAGLLSMGGEHVPATYHRALEELSRRWNETAVLATVAGDSVINLDAVETDSLIRAHPPLRQRRPMWPGSYGKCFLAFMDPQLRDSYLSRHHKNPQERASILAELEVVRENRVAFNPGETDPEMFGIASPILSSDSTTVTFCIGLAAPIGRMPADLSEMAASVRAAAAALSFGGTTP